MHKRLYLFLPIACLAADCGPGVVPSLSSEWRIDTNGDRDLIESHSTDMCVAPNGTVYVVWIDDRDGGDDIWFNRKLPQGERHEGWLRNAVKVNAFTESNVWAPKVACTDQVVHVVWEDDRDGEVESHQIYYQKSVDLGDTWLEGDVLLEEDVDGRSNSFSPQIEARQNFVFVTWYDDLNGAYDILATASQDSGISFSVPARVDTDSPAGSAWSAHPRMAVTDDGQNVYIAWQDFRNGVGLANAGSDIYFNRSTNRGLDYGETDVRLDGGDGGAASAFAPRVAAAGAEVYTVWHDDRNGANDVFMTYSSDGGITWSTDSRADQADGAGFNESLYPKVCIANGRAHVIWHDNRTQGFYRVFHNAATAGGWAGADYRLDEYKIDGQRGVWRFDGGAESVQLACDGSNILAVWLDTAEDAADLGFNDV
ncbi:MAG: hypothetical protein KC656_06780, partial [Myxococcales bacterium]|nr:hypothetical protein [Myxococcales bacterium]